MRVFVNDRGVRITSDRSATLCFLRLIYRQSNRAASFAPTRGIDPRPSIGRGFFLCQQALSKRALQCCYPR